VATHGRAFWILDDLAPVRQWSAAISTEKAHLFTPQVASQTVFPTRPNGLRYFGGANPPAGAVIDYWLSPSFGTARPAPDEKKEDADKKAEAPDPLASRIRIDILDSAGRVIRTIPDPQPEAKEQAKTTTAVKKEEQQGEEDEEAPKPAKLTHYAGLNSFVWDMRYPNATSIPHSPLWAGSVRGPRALPGNYQVRLTVDGKSQVQPLFIAPDPRGTATPEALSSQFELHRQINDELTLVHDTVLDIRAARAKLEARKAANPALAAQIDAENAKMTAIEEELIQPRAHASEDALNYPVKLNNMIAALGSLVDEGDFAPTVQDQQEFVQLKSEADAEIAAWNALKAGELKALLR
jgi:hypothetical protein